MHVIKTGRLRKSRVRKWNDQKHDQIPEVINRATRRAAASMKRKQKENN